MYRMLPADDKSCWVSPIYLSSVASPTVKIYFWKMCSFSQHQCLRRNFDPGQNQGMQNWKICLLSSSWKYSLGILGDGSKSSRRFYLCLEYCQLRSRFLKVNFEWWRCSRRWLFRVLWGGGGGGVQAVTGPVHLGEQANSSQAARPT